MTNESYVFKANVTIYTVKPLHYCETMVQLNICTAGHIYKNKNKIGFRKYKKKMYIKHIYQII